MAMRGIDFIAATAFLAELGDLSRFQSARELMGCLGLVPSEHSTGEKVKRSGITKAGNRRARRILVECSWSYRHPPRVGKEKLAKVAAAPRAVQEIAWKAQSRLSARYPAGTGCPARTAWYSRRRGTLSGWAAAVAGRNQPRSQKGCFSAAMRNPYTYPFVTSRSQTKGLPANDSPAIQVADTRQRSPLEERASDGCGGLCRVFGAPSAPFEKDFG
jgi:hypothetical protein